MLSRAFWSVFESTGSVLAYLLYRHYLRAERDAGADLLQ
mgnify:CR=1 FL=1|jgi:hypothetical protein